MPSEPCTRVLGKKCNVINVRKDAYVIQAPNAMLHKSYQPPSACRRAPATERLDAHTADVRSAGHGIQDDQGGDGAAVCRYGDHLKSVFYV